MMKKLKWFALRALLVLVIIVGLLWLPQRRCDEVWRVPKASAGQTVFVVYPDGKIRVHTIVSSTDTTITLAPPAPVVGPMPPTPPVPPTPTEGINK